MIDKRTLLMGMLAAGCASVGSGSGDAPIPPTVAQLQDGDFLWPRKPDAWIPYLQNELQTATEATERAAFEAGKADFLARRKELAPALSDDDVRRIARMSYEDFRRIYGEPGRRNLDERSLGNFSVGHVAIVSVDGSGPPSLVEAVWGSVKKVRRMSFTDWMNEHNGNWVFHGRLKDRSQADRTALRMEAAKHIDKPYDFWNFDLDNDRGFYCSKLAWMAAYRALGIALDGHMNPKRGIWFSPKQMFNCRTIEHLNGCCYIA